MRSSMRSLTAEGAALARAVAVHDKDSWLRGPDHLVVHLLSPSRRAVATIPALRALAGAAYELAVPGMYVFHCVRTGHFDDIFVNRIEAGVRQIVILGAGLDTRAYRFAHRLRDARIFEVDHPRTAAWKQQRLRQALPWVPDNVAYVSVDFEIDSLPERLRAAGFDPAQRTFFLWEGVMMYLKPETVDDTLAFLTTAAPGSSLAFEYLYADAFRRPEHYFGATRLFRYVAARGEPYLFGIDPDGMDDFLAARGMRTLSHVRAQDFARMHLERRDWTPRRRMIDFWGAVHAEIVIPFRPAHAG
jgi:methyltransferase (TIGR00027 family)